LTEYTDAELMMWADYSKAAEVKIGRIKAGTAYYYQHLPGNWFLTVNNAFRRIVESR
jgi:hypothetical protein